jgi:simple sugar transport system ATP-binding protein
MADNGSDTPLVYMENITRRFGLIEALRDVDFVVNRAEIVGLVGDNGAGKSTLIKVLTGIHPPTVGRIYFEGEPVVIESPKKARALGIETVYQDLALVNLMSVARNFYLGRELEQRIGPLPFLDKETMNAQSVQALHHIGIEIRRPDEEVLRLSGGERQSIAIGRAVYFGLKLLILDEPASALSVGETQKVLNYTLEAKRAGLSVIFITHNIGHVYQVADRFTIVSHGHKVGDFMKDEVSQEEIASMIMGGPVPARLKPAVGERAVEIRTMGDSLAEAAAPTTEEIARQASVRSRNIILAAVAAGILLILLLLGGSGAFSPPPPSPTATPTPTVEAEIPADVLEAIDQLQNDADPGRRAVAAAKLGAKGHLAAVEPLIEALLDDDYGVRERAARALGRLGDERAIDPLQELLRDNMSTVRDAAAEALQTAFGMSCSASDGCR